MKTFSQNSLIIKQSLFRSVLLIMALSIIPAGINAQDFKKFAVGPAFGIGIGVFNPEGVNKYISNDLTDYITFNTDLYMYEEVHLGVNFKSRWFDVTPLIEYALGPKIVIGGNGNYYFNRLSPGVFANFFIPAGMSGKNAIFIGGGTQLHMMTFEGYKGSDLGFRLHLGYDLQFGNFNLQPTLAFNVAKTIGENPSGSLLDMNYTGGQIGVNMSFHKPVSHRNF